MLILYSEPVSTMQSRRDIIRLLGASAAAAFAHRLGASEDRLRLPAGAVIRTVLKDLPPESLAGGATLFHEHLSVGPDFMPKVMAQFRTLLGPDVPLPPPASAQQRRSMQDLGVMAQEMRAAAAEGVACIVDAGHPDMGRNFQFLKQLSLKSGMPIVAGAGYYTQPFYPPEIARWDEDEITQELLRQVKAEAIGAFGEIGTSKAEVQKALCKRGAFVGVDRQGGPGDRDQIPAVLALIEAGFAAKLLFSSDFSFASDLEHYGGAGYAMTVTVFGPKLLEVGVSRSTLHGILVDNPRRLLAFVPKMPRGA